MIMHARIDSSHTWEIGREDGSVATVCGLLKPARKKARKGSKMKLTLIRGLILSEWQKEKGEWKKRVSHCETQGPSHYLETSDCCHTSQMTSSFRLRL